MARHERRGVSMSKLPSGRPPWSVSENNPWNVLDGNGHLLAAVHFITGYQATEREAAQVTEIARKIAAVPELIAALTALVKSVDTGEHPTPDLYIAALAALRKAGVLP